MMSRTYMTHHVYAGRHLQAQAQGQSLRYVWVDLRLSKSVPVSGQYFPIDPNAGKYKHPLPIANLEKFNM